MWKQLRAKTFLQKSSIIDVWKGSKYVSYIEVKKQPTTDDQKCFHERGNLRIKKKKKKKKKKTAKRTKFSVGVFIVNSKEIVCIVAVLLSIKLFPGLRNCEFEL